MSVRTDLNVDDLLPDEDGGALKWVDTTGEVEGATTVTTTGFVIGNDNKADWALRTVQENRRETARLIALCEQQIQELEDKKAALAQEEQNKNGYLLHALHEYFDTVPHRDTKTQSTYRLLSGTLVKKLSRVEIKRDEAALAQWLVDNDYGKYTRVTVKPLWGELKKSLDISADPDTGICSIAETGEIIDGLTAGLTPASFDIK